MRSWGLLLKEALISKKEKAGLWDGAESWQQIHLANWLTVAKSKLKNVQELRRRIILKIFTEAWSHQLKRLSFCAWNRQRTKWMEYLWVCLVSFQILRACARVKSFCGTNDQIKMKKIKRCLEFKRKDQQTNVCSSASLTRKKMASP